MQRRFLVSPLNIISSGWSNRKLILRLAWREIESRYKSSILGMLWAVLVPLLMLAVYTLVFSVIFESRWGNRLTNKLEFSLVLFAGMICFNFFAECINRAPGLMHENISFIKKVVFPLNILAWVVVLVALFNALISFFVLLTAYIIVFGTPPLTILLLPIVVAPLFLLTLSLTWVLSSLGVYVRDIRQAVGIFVTVLMFLSPIFYPMEAVPAKLKFAIWINPLGISLEWVRGAMFWGLVPQIDSYIIFLVISLIFVWLSASWFEATKKGFADVI